VADIEVYRTKHKGYIRPVSEAGKRFVQATWAADEIMTDGIVQFNLDNYEDIIQGLKEIAEGLDIEIR